MVLDEAMSAGTITFWSGSVSQDAPLRVAVARKKALLHVTMACFASPPLDSTSAGAVLASTGGASTPVTLCNLRSRYAENVKLELYFENDVTFYVKGSCAVQMSGCFVHGQSDATASDVGERDTTRNRSTVNKASDRAGNSSSGSGSGSGSGSDSDSDPDSDSSSDSGSDSASRKAEKRKTPGNVQTPSKDSARKERDGKTTERSENGSTDAGSEPASKRQRTFTNTPQERLAALIKKSPRGKLSASDIATQYVNTYGVNFRDAVKKKVTKFAKSLPEEFVVDSGMISIREK